MPIRVAGSHGHWVYPKPGNWSKLFVDNSRTLDGFINENSKQEKLQSKL
jgi:hypothetical protein